MVCAAQLIFLLANCINTYNMHNEHVTRENSKAPIWHYFMHFFGLGLVLEAAGILNAKRRLGNPDLRRLRALQRFATVEVWLSNQRRYIVWARGHGVGGGLSIWI